MKGEYPVKIRRDKIKYMELYEIKRIIKQKNKGMYKILKKASVPLNYIKGLPVKIRENKKIRERLKVIDNNDKKVLYVGIPLHSNLGDQAQYYCIGKWLEKNYPEYKVIEMPDCLINSNFLGINNKIKKIINKHWQNKKI